MGSQQEGISFTSLFTKLFRFTLPQRYSTLKSSFLTSVGVKLMNPERDPQNITQTEHCLYHIRVICLYEAYLMRNNVKDDLPLKATIINSAMKK